MRTKLTIMLLIASLICGIILIMPNTNIQASAVTDMTDETTTLAGCIKRVVGYLEDEKDIYLHSLGNNGRDMVFVGKDACDNVPVIATDVDTIARMLEESKCNKPLVADREYLIAFYIQLRDMYDVYYTSKADDIIETLTDAELALVDAELASFNISYYYYDRGTSNGWS